MTIAEHVRCNRALELLMRMGDNFRARKEKLEVLKTTTLELANPFLNPLAPECKTTGYEILLSNRLHQSPLLSSTSKLGIKHHDLLVKKTNNLHFTTASYFALKVVPLKSKYR